MRTRFGAVALAVLVAGVATPVFAQEAAAPPALTRAQMADFLLHAKIFKRQALSKGITKPTKVTLSDGTIMHDAVFQSVDQTIQRQQFVDGRVEMYFRDSYHYNIAAYRIAELIGMGHMLPVTVEREWDGRKGSLAWWVDWKWDEHMRRKQGVRPPPERRLEYSNDLHLSRLFGQLVYDTDRNQTNTLISADWRLYMIDFTRAFRTSDKLLHAESIQRCSREVLAALEALTRESVARAVGDHLEPAGVTGLLARRDRIVQRIRDLVKERGEKSVLF
jgi:hypothetical protein